MPAIEYTEITRVSSTSVGLSGDTSLRIVDFWVEDSLATSDTISADALGVSAIRGVLGVTSVNGGVFVTQATSAITMNCEKRARAASYAAGSSEPSAAASGDADQLILTGSLNGHEAMWLQLLVEA